MAIDSHVETRVPAEGTCPSLFSPYISLFLTCFRFCAQFVSTMAEQFSSIPALDDSAMHWRILGRVSGKWLAVKLGSRSDDVSFECMIIDRQDDHILKVTILRDGVVSVVSHFHVSSATQFELATSVVKSIAAGTKKFGCLDGSDVQVCVDRAVTDAEGSHCLLAERMPRTRFGGVEPESGFTLQEIQNMPRDCLRDRQFRIVVDVVQFELGNFRCYYGCPVCSRKINQRHVRINCEGCSARGIYAVPCYKIEAACTDGSDICTFLLFTTNAEHVVGLPLVSVGLTQPTTRRRIVPLFSNLIGTRWDLHIGVNVKSLTMPKLMFNVIKVVGQLPSQSLLALPSSSSTDASMGYAGTRTASHFQFQSASAEFGNSLNQRVQLSSHLASDPSVASVSSALVSQCLQRQLGLGMVASRSSTLQLDYPLNSETDQLCDQQQSSLSEVQLVLGNIAKAVVARWRNMLGRIENAYVGQDGIEGGIMDEEFVDRFWNEVMLQLGWL